MSRVVITGPSGGAPNRLEINTFVQNDKFFSLYIQALQQVYATPENLDQSFFQVAGIHGEPYIPWNGAVGDVPFDPSAQYGGYCVHGSVLFPTWHRPYLMLFEQIVQTKAKAIAATYTVNKAEWVQAAENLRQPYWDWAVNSVPPAAVISLENVPITVANGSRRTVPNPFFKYTFQSLPSTFPSPYNRWRQTYRQPSGTINNPTTNVTRLTNALRSSQTNIRSSTYTMLTRTRTWTAFSNHTVGDGGSGTSSIEAIHDNIHVLVGGNGHMSDPSVAAFDPIFWLHHCNVDRMTSLWAALHPGVWVSRGDSENGTFTMSPEVPVDQNTPLTPFWNSDTTFWPSSTTQDTGRLGYTYPEFNGLDMGNAVAVQTAITAIVNRLYSGRATARVASVPFASEIQAAFAKPMASSAESPVVSAAAAPAAAVIAPAPASLPPVAGDAVEAERSRGVGRGHAHGHGHAHPAPAPHPVDTGRDSGLWDWTTRVEFKKYELNCSFSVLIFLGPVPEDPEEWLTTPSFVGMHSAFVNGAAGHCANCRNNAGLIEEGFIHLDEGIIRLAHLTNLEPDAVVPFLKDNLSWRVQKTDGTVADLSSLEVKVFAIPLSYPPGADFPVPGERQQHNHITHGKHGGSRHA